MVDPQDDAPSIVGSPLAEALLGLLRAVRESSDQGSLLAGAVGALAPSGTGCAWIAGDPGERDGQLRVLAAAGSGADVVWGVRSAASAGSAPWRDACAAHGLALAVWAPLGAITLPAAHLGIAVAPDVGTAGWPAQAAGAEIARCIGAAVDARANQATAERRLLTSGRVAWLEAVRQISRAIGHDLANVLTGISFYSSEIAGEIPPGANADDAAAISESVSHAVRLIEQLRGLWREASETQIAPLDPAAVVDAITGVLTAAARPATLAVGPLDSMVVRASRRTLEETVLALVVEASAAAASSGVGASAATIRVGVVAEVLAPGNATGLGAGRYAAVVVDGDASPRDTTLAGARASLADPSPGEPGFALALAAAGAKAAGGGVRVEGRRGNGVRTTVLLPEATSRRRSGVADQRGGAAAGAPPEQGSVGD